MRRVGLNGIVSLAFVLIAAACSPTTPPPPDPAALGPFSTTSSSVTSTPGFGDGTMFYPDSAPGPFPIVAIAPGYFQYQERMAWIAPRIASHGFVVVNLDANNSVLDFPNARGDQLLAALDHLPSEPAVAAIADGSRQAVMGWSMGGGGALSASLDRPSLMASIPLAPWENNTNFSGVTVPTMVIACESDGTASVNSHAIPIYNSIPATTDKAYVELDNAPHGCVTDTSTSVQKDAVADAAIAFLKRHVAGDLVYETLLCPTPAATAPLSERLATCPGF